MGGASEVWRQLEAPMRRALELAWESACSLSLGIGAVVTDGDGKVVATGRNRLFEQDPGDDVLAGSPLAHAEMNALAKLRVGDDHSAHTVWTTLEPCIQCAGAIRIAGIGYVRLLSPDPLFADVGAAMRDLSEHVASKWADVQGPASGSLSAFGLLLPLHTIAFWQIQAMLDLYEPRVPELVALANEVARSGELVAAAEAGTPVDAVLAGLWDRLAEAAPPAGL